MNVKVEDVSSIKKKLTFQVAPERVDKEIAKAFKKIGKKAKIKGFRPGKIPQTVLEQYYGAEMQQEVLTQLINDTYFKALIEHDVQAIGEPSIVDSSGVSKGEAFTYEAEVEIKPEVEVKDYTGIPLEKEKFVMDPKVVDERLEDMRSSRSQVEETTRKKAREGDICQIDFEGFIDGEAFEGGKGEDFQLELGSGTFIPGFEDQVVGMKREDEKDIEVSFPEDYGKDDLAGKPAVFKVKLREIKEKVLPKIDDDFAKGFGVDSLDELKEQLEANHTTQEQNRIEGDLREQLAKALIERNPIEVPDAMVASQLKYMYDNIVNRMQSQGMTPEMLGLSPENFQQQYRDTAVDQVKGSLLMEAVGRQENITADESDIDAKIEEIATMANAPVDVVKNYYASGEARTSLIAQIAEEKVIEFLLDKAKIKEISAKKAAEKKAAKEDA